MLLLVGAGFSAVGSHCPIRLVTLGLLPFPDVGLSIVVYIGSLTVPSGLIVPVFMSPMDCWPTILNWVLLESQSHR